MTDAERKEAWGRWPLFQCCVSGASDAPFSPPARNEAVPKFREIDLSRGADSIKEDRAIYGEMQENARAAFKAFFEAFIEPYTRKAG